MGLSLLGSSYLSSDSLFAVCLYSSHTQNGSTIENDYLPYRIENFGTIIVHRICGQIGPSYMKDDGGDCYDLLLLTYK
jgi:hypothetical protein